MHDTLSLIERLIEAEIAYRAAEAKADDACTAWLALTRDRDAAARARDDARAAVNGAVENLSATVWAVTRGVVALPVTEAAE